MSTATTRDFTILCVCAGNIHRSVLAEALLETWASWYLPEDVARRVRVISAGLIAEPGVPMGGRAQRIASALGAHDRVRTSTTLTDRLLEDADLVLTATRGQADAIVSRVPGALRITFTMREAGRISRSLVSAGILPASATAPASATRDGFRRHVAEMADRRERGVGDEDDVIDPQGKGEAAFLQMTGQEVPALAAVAAALFGMSEPDFRAYVQASRDPAVLMEDAGGASGGGERS